MRFDLRNWLKHRKRRKFLRELRTMRHAEDDILSPEDRRDFDALIERLAASGASDREAISEAKTALAKIDHGLRSPALRELLDLLLVVGAVAFGIRGLFLQPFRIPTGSMQPTLYGIHYQYRDAGKTADNLASPLQALLFARRRVAATEIREDGTVDPTGFRVSDGMFKTDTSFRIGNVEYTLPGEPKKVCEYAELDGKRVYRRGEKLCGGGFLALGDHLFVERISLYLREPKRGDVTVFNTEDLEVKGQKLAELSGYYYIKRLAGLPGDTLKIENGRLYIRPRGKSRFVPVEELDSRFKKIFSGKGGYHGYLNGPEGFFLAPGTEYTVPEDHYFMLGDNSRFSLDSRYFGPVPRRNLVGRAFLVFWPFSRRWGRADLEEPLDVPTGDFNSGSYRVMYRQ